MWCGICVILISLGTVCSMSYNPRVKTKFGTHEGIWTETIRGQRVAGYLGIPYAKPPIGDLRFQKPIPWTKQWRRSRDSTRYASPCVPFRGSKIGSEDCLYLNIFTPQVEQYSVRVENETNRAVLVFLIGGMLKYNGYPLYDPSYLLDQDIVLVTVNYRYGFFGFFTTGDEAAPGNYGLKDVLEALKWIQRNIPAFGGDAEAVTLMGQGTGAGIVHLLALSDKSEGLFHRYVTQSGAAQAPWSIFSPEEIKNTSLQSASLVNCSQSVSQEIVECMRDIPAYKRTEHHSFPLLHPWSTYGPTIEPESEEAVITEHPKTLMKNGKLRDIPWLTGVVADEGLMMAVVSEEDTMCHDLAKNFEDIVFWLANNRHSIADPPAYVQELATFYYDGNLTVDCDDSFYEMVGDIVVNWPVYEAVTNQATNMKSSVYFYNFAYNGTFTITFELDESNRFGICHGDELNYLFPVLNNLFEDLLQRNTENDRAMINILTEMWANFAKTGVPSARFTPEWKSYQDGGGYMEFGQGAEISMQKDFLNDRMIFWHNLTTEQFISEPDIPPNVDNGGAMSARGDMDDIHKLKNLLSLLAVLLITEIIV